MYNGRKRETITAEVFVRKPMNVKPTVISIPASDKETKKPCWIIVKAYESSSPSTISKKDLRKKFDETMLRIGSAASSCKNIRNTEKLKVENSYEKVSTVIIPEVKQETSERCKIEPPISSDPDLQSEMNHVIESVIDTSIKSTKSKLDKPYT